MSTLTIDQDRQSEREARERIGRRNMLSLSLNELEGAHDRLNDAAGSIEQVLELVSGYEADEATALLFRTAAARARSLGAVCGHLERVIAARRDALDLSL